MQKIRTEDTPLLRVSDIKKYYPLKDGFGSGKGRVLRAVDGVSFDLYKGETLGLVGESGCGKSTLGRQLVALERPDGGSVLYKGKDLARIKGREMKAIRTQLQMVFQDSYSSLNPRKRVFDILAEPMLYHKLADKRSVEGEVGRLLDMVGLPSHAAARYPHEFSGGQRQRIGIARALCLKPEFLVCDEPVSALDVSIQAQVLNLLKDLQAEFHLTYLFITHDLSVVKFFSDKIAVMYLGQLVETADSAELFRQPLHPYSQALLSAIPIPSSRQKMQRVKLIGELQSPIDPEPGCRFAKRCLYAREGCTGRDLALRDFGSGHFCACCRAGALEEQTPSK